MLRRLAAISFALAVPLALLHSAGAVIANKGSADLGGNGAAPGSSYSAPYTVNSASNMLVIEAVNNNADGSTLTATYAGANMLLGCGPSTGSISPGTVYFFYLLNPSTGTHDVVVNSSSPIGMQVGGADYSGVGSFESCKSDYGPAVTSGTNSLTTTVGVKSVNDWVIMAAAGYQTQTAGTGDVLRVQDATLSQWGLFDSNAGLTIGNHSLTTSLGTTNAIVHLAMVFTPSNPGPIPTAINCSPNTPSLLDSAASGVPVCVMTVTMSDGSTYTGTNTITPTSTFAVPATGNGNVTISRSLSPSDDGFLTAALNVSYNNAILSKTITLAVVPGSAPGTPMTIGWKNTDPGAASSSSSCPTGTGFSCDGQIIFTAPHTFTVYEVTMRVASPSPAAALVDVYKVGSGLPCSAGVKLHSGDFNVAGPVDQVQVLPLSTVSGATSLAVGDSVCVVTQQPFPATSQATVSVSIN